VDSNARDRLTADQRRARYAARKVLALVAVSAAALALIVADTLGLFGRARVADLQKYDGKTFRVVKVVDGDTLDVDAPDGEYPHTRIRLWGVDTPETVRPNTPPQHFGLEASDFTRRQALDANARLELDPSPDKQRDKYGRLLAYVHLPDGRMLNRVLVEEGYGYADERFPHRYSAEFKRLEAQARKAGKGLWKDLKPEDLPDYRRRVPPPQKRLEP
jgi:micrococcal nuclease